MDMYDREFFECSRFVGENLGPCYVEYGIREKYRYAERYPEEARRERLEEERLEQERLEQERQVNVEKKFPEEAILLIVAVFALVFVLVIIWPITAKILNLLAKRRSKRTSLATRVPFIPFPQEELYEYRGDNHKKHVIPDVRILCSPTSKAYCTSSEINKLMVDLFKIKVSQDDETSTKLGKKCPVPKNSRVISIKMDGFRHGVNLHDFEPIEGAAPRSYYTYQMLGDNRIQVTNYVEGGVSYPAGYCIYFKKIGIREQEFPMEVIRGAWTDEAQKYPGRMAMAHSSKLSFKRLSQISCAPSEGKGNGQEMKMEQMKSKSSPYSSIDLV